MSAGELWVSGLRSGSGVLASMGWDEVEASEVLVAVVDEVGVVLGFIGFVVI